MEYVEESVILAAVSFRHPLSSCLRQELGLITQGVEARRRQEVAQLDALQEQRRDPCLGA